ncbi:hypothetical protein, partial [Thiolapillus sp.]
MHWLDVSAYSADLLLQDEGGKWYLVWCWRGEKRRDPAVPLAAWGYEQADSSSWRIHASPDALGKLKALALAHSTDISYVPLYGDMTEGIKNLAESCKLSIGLPDHSYQEDESNE